MMRLCRLHNDDNVIVALEEIAPGSPLAEAGGLKTVDRIPPMHKVAVQPIKKGEPVRKYQQIIGFAGRDIKAGEHVHVHNCVMGDFERDYAFCRDKKEQPLVPEHERRHFMGYRRTDGKAGTRNYIGIITTVNCSATVARQIERELDRPDVLEQYPNVDGIVTLTHHYGCGMGSDERDEGYANMLRLMSGYARHPNFAAVLMIGLGCEVMQVGKVAEQVNANGNLSPGEPSNVSIGDERFRTLTIQESGGTREAVAAGVAAVREMLPRANACRREEIPVSELTLALQCGGSDAFSGITANPALGAAADLLVAQGGTAILSETPEIYGAEHLLTRRAVSREVGEKLLERINWWVQYTAATGGKMGNNPSPGNKEGGLTTILEKSLGAQAKGGTSNLAGVYKYGEPIDTHGLVFMDSPGFDPASVTGQVASGANVVCFTTGRGSAFGFKPAPSIKLATNTPLFERMTDDMDINCGTVIEGRHTIQEKGREIFEHIIRVASGEPTKSEELGYGDNEFTPWQIGTVM